MSSDCNSFPSVCLLKKRQRLGGLELTTLRGLELFALCVLFFFFFFFHPPSCAAVIASSLLLPAARERERDTQTLKEREKGKESLSERGRVWKEAEGGK